MFAEIWLAWTVYYKYTYMNGMLLQLVKFFCFIFQDSTQNIVEY